MRKVKVAVDIGEMFTDRVGHDDESGELLAVIHEGAGRVKSERHGPRVVGAPVLDAGGA